MNYLRPNLPRPVYQLGTIPITHNYAAGNDQDSYPLEFQFTEEGNLKLTHNVDSSALFSYYTYQSQLLSEKHIRDRINYAEKMFDSRFGECGRPPDYVLEIASNDGYLLNEYVEHRNVTAVGVDPARNLHRYNHQNVKSFPIGLTDDLTELLQTQFGYFDIIHAHNVLAHVRLPSRVLQNIEKLMDDTSVAVIEFQYMPSMIRNCMFYHLYHEHRHYLSLHGFWALCDHAGLDIIDVGWHETQGGSILCTVGKKETVRNDFRNPAVKILLEGELDLFSKENVLDEFVAEIDSRLCRFAEYVNKQDKVYGMCANAKGVVVINLAIDRGLDPSKIECIYDDAEMKQGHTLPGTEIPIKSPAEIELNGTKCILFAPHLLDLLQKQLTTVEFVTLEDTWRD